MRLSARAAACILPLFLAGCDHLPIHKHPPLVPLNQLPYAQNTEPIDLVVVEPPPSMWLIPGKPLYNMRVHDMTVQPPVRHRKPAPPQELPPPPEPAVNPAPAVSAIGSLSSGDAGSNRWQAEQSIVSVERGLNSINRNLDDSESKTADHIREFLKQARAALSAGDMDGARTLAAKAKVLLDDLTK